MPLEGSCLCGGVEQLDELPEDGLPRYPGAYADA
ncbi:MAG: hypothetical protein QOD43_1139 [Gaiellaceae bacterium]|nr:hypothetical protein [Gaiellaceae bacterium]